jgi:3-isopropylmalate dehydrogenase
MGETPLRLLVLEGDGIGPEICAATLAVLEAAAGHGGFALAIERAGIGFAALTREGTTLPEAVVEKARAAQGIILGPVSHNDYPPAAEGGVNPSGELRRRLDLFANLRPARTRPGLVPRCGRPVDLLIVRENTEGFYADRSMHAGPGEMMPTPDLALSFRKVTRQASLRIARQGFEAARARRGRLTAVHKANVLRVSDGLFLDCVREVGRDFPDIDYEEQLVDAMAALLVRDASRFDVIVTTNMFGDILSDEASEIAGGLGLAASLNAGAGHAAAQAQHGSAPGLAGRDIANPGSMIGSAALLLGWLGRRLARPELAAAGEAIDRALDAALADPATRTPDLGGTLGTSAFAAAVAGHLRVAEPAA